MLGWRILSYLLSLSSRVGDVICRAFRCRGDGR